MWSTNWVFGANPPDRSDGRRPWGLALSLLSWTAIVTGACSMAGNALEICSRDSVSSANRTAAARTNGPGALRCCSHSALGKGLHLVVRISLRVRLMNSVLGAILVRRGLMNAC